MRLHRFHVSQPLGEEVVINDVSLVGQWTRVFRYAIGDSVILFNGNGSDYRYTLQEITKKECTLILIGSAPSYIPRKKITLCLSVIKKDNFELATQKVTELGITTIIPILSSRSEKKNLSLERLQKIATEASEQCGRGDIPLVSPITSLQEVLSMLQSGTKKKGLYFDIGGSPLPEVHKKIDHDQELYFFIGPEGGWGEEDLALIDGAHVQKCSIGETVLRAETAAIVASALLIL